MSLASRSIRRPVAVAMLFLAAVLLGVISFTRLPIDLFPDIAYPRLVIYTGYANVAPAEVERFVTEPIERALAAVPGVEQVESVSREATSLVTLRFAWGTDMDFAALNVREKLDNLRGALPELSQRPVVLRTDPRSEPILALSVSGAGDLWSLKDLAESVFKRRLEQIDGIAEAAVTGGLEREIHVEVDPRRLESHGVTIDDVASALDAANRSAPGGSIRRGRYRYPLRTLGEFQTVEEIADVPLASGLLIRDVARVEDGFRERDAIARYNGREAVGMLLFKESGANTVRVTERVEEVLEQLRGEYSEVQVEIATAQAGFISAALSTVIQEVILGAILAFLVLFLFLRNARYPVAVAVAMPISVVATFALLHAAGVSLNLMSLGGLALGVGLLLDNSIVVLENIFRLRERREDAGSSAARGAEEVQTALTASTLTTIAVFGPIVYVQSVAGELFGALSFAVAFALLVSLVVSFTLLPVLAARWKPAGESGGTRVFRAFDRQFRRFANWYERVLASALVRRRRVVVISAALLLVAGALALTLERSLLPNVDQGAFRARLVLPRGTPLEQTAEAAARMERRLLEDPAVQAVFARVGRQEAIGGIGLEESGPHTATLDVRLRRGASARAAAERLRAELAQQVPAATLALETRQATSLGRLLGGGEAELAVRVRGDDLESAIDYAQRAQARLAGVAGLTNVRLGTELGQPEVRVEIERERAASYGIDPGAVARTVEAYMRGAVATEFVAFDRKVPVVVRLPEEARHSLATLEQLRVGSVPLRELVTAHTGSGPAAIRRVDQGRIVPVYADVASGGVDEGIAITRAALTDLPVPPGLRVELGGENEEMRRSFRDLAFALALALLLVYMILAAEFESLLHPFTVLLTVPLAAVGAVLALWVTGAGVNAVSLIGLIVLIGIVDNDAVVKLDLINRLRREGVPRRRAIMEAGRARLRPIIMNTLTAMLGVLPLAIGIGPGAELQAPMAIVVFGGLFSATALTLVVIPVAYELVEDGWARVQALFGGPESLPAPEKPALAPAPERQPVLAGVRDDDAPQEQGISP